jgi:hypothetical protein
VIQKLRPRSGDLQNQQHGNVETLPSTCINEKYKNSNSTYISIECPEDLKIRPIVAGPACKTHRISYLLDLLLKPYTGIVKVPNYLRDTMNFLNSLPDVIKPESILVSFDATHIF